MRREAVRLPDVCPACGAPGHSLTCIADIPHFKEVMIMAFDCESCGFKSSEVSRDGTHRTAPELALPRNAFIPLWLLFVAVAVAAAVVVIVVCLQRDRHFSPRQEMLEGSKPCVQCCSNESIFLLPGRFASSPPLLLLTLKMPATGQGRRRDSSQRDEVHPAGSVHGRLPKRRPQVRHGRVGVTATRAGNGDGHPRQHVHHRRGAAQQGMSGPRDYNGILLT